MAESSVEPKASAGLMDFKDEEEDDDNNDEQAATLLKKAERGQGKPKDSLMDFADEEEEDEQDRLLKSQQQPKKKKMMIASEDEDEEEEEEEREDEEEEKQERGRKRQRKERLAESPTKEDMEEDEEERSDGGEEDYVETTETISTITVPSLEAYRTRPNSKCYLTQLPRFLFIAGGAYDEQTYKFEKEKAEIQASNGEHLVGDEVVRWRVRCDPVGRPILNREGQPELESNARIVEYTDGTYQIFVGNEAIDLKVSTTQNEFLYARTTETSEEGNERLSLQALCPVTGQATFRPAGPNSKQHKALESVVKRQQVKVVNMVDTNPDVDPEKEQDEKIKQVDAIHRKNLRRRNRAENSLAARKRRLGEEWTSEYLEKPETTGRKKAGGKKRGGGGRKDDDEEEEEYEEEEEEELDSFIASSSEDDDDDE